MEDVVLTPPSAQPISLSEAKAQSRVDTSDEDSLFSSYVQVATEQVESLLARSLVLQKRRTYLDYFPHTITLPTAPIREVASIVYVNQNGVETTLATSVYLVAKDGERARITPKDGQYWPVTESDPHAVRVEYFSGYSAPFVADFSNNRLTVANTGYSVGDSVYIWNSGGALPTGLTEGSYTVSAVTSTYIELTGASFSDAGTGTHFIGYMPERIKQCIQWLAGHLYENRAATTQVDVKELPLGLQVLLSGLQVVRF